MADKVEFELVSPERLLLSQPVDMVVVPGTGGDFGVLPCHTPMISGVRTGTIDIYEDDKRTQRIFVAGGFAEVTAERCTVLAEGAVAVDDLDRAVIDAELADAEARLRDAVDDAERTVAKKDQSLAQAKLAVLSS